MFIELRCCNNSIDLELTPENDIEVAFVKAFVSAGSKGIALKVTEAKIPEAGGSAMVITIPEARP